jgi:hypothetical protein
MSFNWVVTDELVGWASRFRAVCMSFLHWFIPAFQAMTEL